MPLWEAKRFLRIIRDRDLSQRLEKVQIAMLTRSPMSEQDGETQQEIMDTFLPELAKGVGQGERAVVSGPNTDGKTNVKEQETLDRLAQVGLFPVRRAQQVETVGSSD